MIIKKLVSGAVFVVLLGCFQAEGANNLSDNGNGTVTDNALSLVWQQGEGGAMTWEAALTYCENLRLAGLADWRLPNTKELLSLVDFSKFNPSLDTAYFPGVVLGGYWSSTTSAYNSAYAWYVNFSSGYVSYTSKTGNVYVRCVRGGQ